MSSKQNFLFQRKIVASTTIEGWKKIPHVCFNFKLNATQLLECAKSNHISVNMYLLYAVVEGIKAAPILNSECHFNTFLSTGKLITHNKIDINFPIIHKNGGMVTVKLQDFGNKNLEAMEQEFKKIKAKIEASNIEGLLYKVGIEDTQHEIKKGHILKGVGRLVGSILEKDKPEKLPKNTDQEIVNYLSKGSITISNIGNLARGKNLQFNLLDIVSPQVCAIGINPISIENQQKMMTFTVAFDHRALDFGDMSPFLDKLESVFEKPEMLLP